MATSTVTRDQFISWLGRFRDLVTEHRDYLTELDSAIGDADHGSNMTRGMNEVMNVIGAAPVATVDEMFKSVGMTLVTSVGGASGPLYGTFFLRFGTALGAVDVVDGPLLSAAFHAGLAGIVARGKAEDGDKTMYDAMAPAIAAFDAALAAGSDLAIAASDAFAAAAAGRDAIEGLVAKKGRASYLGERSAGHLDPGSVSTTYLFEALAQELSVV